MMKDDDDNDDSDDDDDNDDNDDNDDDDDDDDIGMHYIFAYIGYIQCHSTIFNDGQTMWNHHVWW